MKESSRSLPAEQVSQEGSVRFTPGRATLGAVIGLAGGVFGGLAGLGGGALMVPMLTGLTGLVQHQAHGSSLLAALFTAAAGGLGYAREGSVDWLAAAAVAAAASVSASMGARYSRRVPARRLRRYFGYFLMAVAIFLPVSRYLMNTLEFGGHPGPVVVVLGGMATGLVSGFASGLLGIGGGAVVVPALAIGLGFPQHLAQGTSLMAMIPSTASGTLTHHRLGHVRWDIAPATALGALVGGLLGAAVALRLSSAALRLVFTAVVFALGWNYTRASGNAEREGAQASGQKVRAGR